MDTAINNGDFMLDERGRPKVLSGTEEILQQILIRLSVKKGSFVYNPELGSMLHTLKGNSCDITKKAFSIVLDALNGMHNVILETVDIIKINNSQNIKLQVNVRVNDQKAELEVVL